MTAVPLPFEPNAEHLVRSKVARNETWMRLMQTSAMFHAGVPIIVVEVAELLDVLSSDRSLTNYQVDRIANDYAHRRLTTLAAAAEHQEAALAAALAASQTEMDRGLHFGRLMREFL